MKKFIYTIALTVSLTGLQAQVSTHSSGGDASGEGGTVSYSVGQVIYSIQSGTTGSVAEGVQQPFEISVVSGIEETGIDIQMSVFPNPTSSFLILKIEEAAIQEFKFTMILYDVYGKIIQQEAIVSNETFIVFSDLKTSTYFLRIIKDNQDVKTFKIIKK